MSFSPSKNSNNLPSRWVLLAILLRVVLVLDLGLYFLGDVVPRTYFVLVAGRSFATHPQCGNEERRHLSDEEIGISTNDPPRTLHILQEEERGQQLQLQRPDEVAEQDVIINRSEQDESNHLPVDERESESGPHILMDEGRPPSFPDLPEVVQQRVRSGLDFRSSAQTFLYARGSSSTTPQVQHGSSLLGIKSATFLWLP